MQINNQNTVWYPLYLATYTGKRMSIYQINELFVTYKTNILDVVQFSLSLVSFISLDDVTTQKRFDWLTSS